MEEARREIRSLLLPANSWQARKIQTFDQGLHAPTTNVKGQACRLKPVGYNS